MGTRVNLQERPLEGCGKISGATWFQLVAKNTRLKPPPCSVATENSSRARFWIIELATKFYCSVSSGRIRKMAHFSPHKLFCINASIKAQPVQFRIRKHLIWIARLNLMNSSPDQTLSVRNPPAICLVFNAEELHQLLKLIPRRPCIQVPAPAIRRRCAGFHNRVSSGGRAPTEQNH